MSDRIKVFLVVPDPALRSGILEWVRKAYSDRVQVEVSESLEAAIERQETRPEKFDLLILAHEGAGLILVKTLLDLGASDWCLLVTSNPGRYEALLGWERAPEIVLLSEGMEGIRRSIRKGAVLGRAPEPGEPFQEDFIEIRTDSLRTLTPLQSDVFLKMGAGHFVCVFKKGSVVEEGDLRKFVDSKREHLHIRRGEINASIDLKVRKISEVAAMPSPDPALVREGFSSGQALLSDLVSQTGFTPEAQNLAKSCVAMALKALGSRPRLSQVLEEIRSREGAYLGDHSLAVGQVACALAHRAGWSSSNTFFKLVLAALLHDLPLKSERLARVRVLDEASSAELDSPDRAAIRLHPVHAADFARQFAEIPSDVDQILIQHHELPVPGGFPRGLAPRFVSPLSALFIMSEDLVDFMESGRSVNFETYFSENRGRYSSAQFKKILAMIQNS